MHLGQRFFILLLGVSFLIPHYASAEDTQKIIIEESPYRKTPDADGDITNLLVPYRERRGSFGSVFSLDYSMYEPINYQPDFLPLADFETQYGSAEIPLIQLKLAGKWNAQFGSLAIEAGAGYYQNSSDNEGVLTLTPFSLGVTLALDTLTPEPYIVPYGTFGTTLMSFEEELGSQGRGGTELHFYYQAGLLLQVDWLDPTGDFNSFNSHGIENTFINLGVLGIIGSPAEDADFTNSMALQAGFKVEI